MIWNCDIQLQFSRMQEYTQCNYTPPFTATEFVPGWAVESTRWEISQHLCVEVLLMVRSQCRD